MGLLYALLSRRDPGFPPGALIESFRHTFARLRKRRLYLRAQRLRHRFRPALAARHAADIRGIAPHLLRDAIINPAAKRWQALQIYSLIIVIVLDAVHGSSRYFECSRHEPG